MLDCLLCLARKQSCAGALVVTVEVVYVLSVTLERVDQWRDMAPSSMGFVKVVLAVGRRAPVALSESWIPLCTQSSVGGVYPTKVSSSAYVLGAHRPHRRTLSLQMTA